MITFKDAVLNVYYPAYKDLYKLNKSMGKKSFTEKLYFIAWNIKTHNVYAGGLNITEKCEVILRQVSNDLSKVTRPKLDEMLFNLLYSLRTELKHFCREFYPLSGHDTLKLENHYTWKRSITLYEDKCYKIK